MRALVFSLAALTLAGCQNLHWNRYDPATPETAEGQIQAEQARAQAELLCGSRGEVTQRDDSDGRNASDWKCERRKP